MVSTRSQQPAVYCSICVAQYSMITEKYFILTTGLYLIRFILNLE